jgi:addiction module HigA family antidote
MAKPIHRDELQRIDLSDVATTEILPNITPGEVLREEFMVPLGLSARALARDLRVPANRITGILHGERAITAETAVLLSERFDTSPEFWMNLQSAFDLEAVRRSRSSRDHQVHERVNRVRARGHAAAARR